jgi:hypothetical protein
VGIAIRTATRRVAGADDVDDGVEDVGDDVRNGDVDVVAAMGIDTCVSGSGVVGVDTGKGSNVLVMFRLRKVVIRRLMRERSGAELGASLSETMCSAGGALT